MISTPLSEDELELCRLLHEKENDIVETLDAKELKLLTHFNDIVALRCEHLLKIVQKGLGIDTFELCYGGIEFDDNRFKVLTNHTKKGKLECTGFWIFPNYYLTLKNDELGPQLVKDKYIEYLSN